MTQLTNQTNTSKHKLNMFLVGASTVQPYRLSNMKMDTYSIDQGLHCFILRVVNFRHYSVSNIGFDRSVGAALPWLACVSCKGSKHQCNMGAHNHTSGNTIESIE